MHLMRINAVYEQRKGRKTIKTNVIMLPWLTANGRVKSLPPRTWQRSVMVALDRDIFDDSRITTSFSGSISLSEPFKRQPLP
jgi:hypothetical protein